jgi:hypothetical protein
MLNLFKRPANLLRYLTKGVTRAKVFKPAVEAVRGLYG